MKQASRSDMFIALLLHDGFTEGTQEGRYRVFTRPYFGEWYYVRKDGRIRLGATFMLSHDMTDQKDWDTIERKYRELNP